MTTERWTDDRLDELATTAAANENAKDAIASMKNSIHCPYCGSKAIFSDAQIVYGRPGFGSVWLCADYPACDSRVSAHRNGLPKGTLANKELREWRKKAHAAFDPWWQSGQVSRNQAYRWLGQQLGIQPKDTHIAMFSTEQCQQVIAAVESRWESEDF